MQFGPLNGPIKACSQDCRIEARGAAPAWSSRASRPGGSSSVHRRAPQAQPHRRRSHTNGTGEPGRGAPAWRRPPGCSHAGLLLQLIVVVAVRLLPPPGQGLVASPNKILVACSSSAFGADVERRKDPGRRENNGQRQPDIEHDLGTLRTNVEDRDDTDHEAADRAACQAPGLQPLANWRFHGTILTPAATTRTAARGWLSAASIANCNSLRPGARYRIEAEAEPRRRRTIRLASQPAWVVRARLSYAPGGYTRPLRRRLRSGQARGRRSPG